MPPPPLPVPLAAARGWLVEESPGCPVLVVVTDDGRVDCSCWALSDVCEHVGRVVGMQGVAA